MTGAEEWKSIPGCGEYEASSHGGIRHWERRKPLKWHCNHGGYPMVCVYRDLKGTTTAVHRLVALTFLGERPNQFTINHRDGNKLNNAVENLEYVTLEENRRHAIEHGLWGFGERNGLAKLTENDVRRIRELEGKMPQYKIGQLFGVSKPAIYAIFKGLTWKHVK